MQRCKAADLSKCKAAQHTDVNETMRRKIDRNQNAKEKKSGTDGRAQRWCTMLLPAVPRWQ